MVLVGSPGAEVMIPAAPVVVGGPGSGAGHEDDLAAPRGLRRAHDDEMVLHEALPVLAQAGRDDPIEARALIRRDPPAVQDRPVAAVHIGGFRGLGEFALQVERLMRHFGAIAVAVDLDVPAVRRSRDAELDRLAGVVRHPVGVDVDFRQVPILARELVAEVRGEVVVGMGLAHGPGFDRVRSYFGKFKKLGGHRLSLRWLGHRLSAAGAGDGEEAPSTGGSSGDDVLVCSRTDAHSVTLGLS